MTLTDGCAQHNKLREYKARATRLERLLKDEKEQSERTKTKYADWNNGLQTKLHTLREEKKAWKMETAALQQAEKDLRVRAFLFINFRSVTHTCV